MFCDHFINSHKLFSCLYIDVGRSWHLKGSKNNKQTNQNKTKTKNTKEGESSKAIDSHASNQLQQHLNCWPVLVG